MQLFQILRNIHLPSAHRHSGMHICGAAAAIFLTVGCALNYQPAALAFEVLRSGMHHVLVADVSKIGNPYAHRRFVVQYRNPQIRVVNVVAVFYVSGIP